MDELPVAQSISLDLIPRRLRHRKVRRVSLFVVRRRWRRDGRGRGRYPRPQPGHCLTVAVPAIGAAPCAHKCWAA